MPRTRRPATFRFVRGVDQIGRRRLSLETGSSAARTTTKTKAEQVADQVVLLLRGDPTLRRAETARKLGYNRDHWTFRSAWTLASKKMAKDGAETAQGERPGARAGRGAPKGGERPAAPTPGTPAKGADTTAAPSASLGEVEGAEVEAADSNPGRFHPPGTRIPLRHLWRGRGRVRL